MRTSINYSSFSSTTYYAVGRDGTEEQDPIFDKFVGALDKFPELIPFTESKNDESVMFVIPHDAEHMHLLINKIAMLAYQGCVFQENQAKPCKRCTYSNYCKAVNGKEV